MTERPYTTPLVPLPRRRALITTQERLQTPHKFGQLEAPTLAGILFQLDKGKPEDWADLVEFALGTDDHLRSLYDTRITRVVQAEYQVVPNEFGNQVQAKLAAEMVNEHLGRIKKWREFMRGALHAEALGYSCSEISWQRDGVKGQIFPEKITPIHPHRFRFDEQWEPRIYDRGSRRVEAVKTSTFVQYGEALNPSGWVKHYGSAVGGYPNSRGYMRSCIWHWMFKRWVESFYIGFIEKYGSARVHGVVPKGATDEVRRKALEALELWTQDGFAVLEEGSTITIDGMDAATSSDTAHAQYIGYIERVHTKAVLGTSDAADPGQNGSQAAVGARTGSTMDPRMKADGMSLCDSLHDQLFYWDCYYNRHLFDGGNMPPVPRMQFKTASDEVKTDGQDLVQQAQAERQMPGPHQVQVPGSLESAMNPPQPQHPGAEMAASANPAMPAPAAVPMTDPMLPNAPAVMAPPPPPAQVLKAADVKYAMDVSKAFKSGEVEYSTACRMLVHFFGCDDATARELVGTPPQPVVPVAPAAPAQPPAMTEQPPVQQPAPVAQPEHQPGHAMSEQDELQLSSKPAQPITPEEAQHIADVVKQFRGGQLDFGKALAALGETSLSWKEAQILLAGAPAQMAIGFRDSVALKFNPGQARDETGKWTDGANAIGGSAPVTADQAAKFEAGLDPGRKAALDQIKSAAGSAAAPQAAPQAPPVGGAPSKRIDEELSTSVFGRHVSDDELDELLGKNSLPEGYSLQTNARKSKRAFQHIGDVELSGGILDKDGNKVGEVIRYYKREKDGSLTVKNHEFFIDDSHQGSGIGKSLFNSQIDAYKKQGVNQVKLEAAQVGRYVWTKAGFEWDDKAQASRIVSQFGEHLSTKYGPETASKIMSQVKTPHDLSRVSVGSEKVGKDFLVNLPEDEQIHMSQDPAKIKRL